MVFEECGSVMKPKVLTSFYQGSESLEICGHIVVTQ